MTITIDKTNEGILNRAVGNTLPDPFVADALCALDESYRAMAAPSALSIPALKDGGFCAIW